MEYLNNEFNLGLAKNENRKDTDLVSDYLRIEVKFDRQMRRTGNVFLEFEYASKPSGILKDEELDILIYGDNTSMVILHAPLLRELVAEWIVTKEFRIVNGGD